MLGGAVGNLTDRLTRGEDFFSGRVVDFIDLQIWPVFNIADTAIVVGAVILAVSSFVGDRDQAASGAALGGPHRRRRTGTPSMSAETYVGEAGRLDAVVARLSGATRADVQRAIADGHVLVDGAARPKSFRLAGRRAARGRDPAERTARGGGPAGAGPLRGRRTCW